MISSILENGRETLDQTPVSLPINFSKPEPLHLRIRRMIIEQMKESQFYEEFDSAEEADDFSVPGDDPFENSPYEIEDDFDHLNDRKWETVPDVVGDTKPASGETTKEGKESDLPS